MAKWIVQLFKEVPYKYLSVFRQQRFLEIALVSLIIFTFIPFTFRPLLRNETQKQIYKQIGLWMKTNFPSGSRVITRKPWIPFYAEMEPIGFPFEPWNKILNFARHRGADYIVADQNVIGNRENLMFLFKDDYISDDAKRIHESEDISGSKIFIYKVLK